MQNMLLEQVEYQVQRTALGEWRRFLYPTGRRFAEFKSHRRMFGLPLIHYTFGICPETGKRIVARGVFAVGRLATGIFAIGHASFGLIALGQLGLGLVFGLGQAATGIVAIGQLAVAAYIAVGQLAIGYVAVGQVAVGTYTLAQVGWGRFQWTPARTDPEAVYFFKELARSLLPK